MRSMPTLAASMTAFPHALDADANLDEADAMMATHDIRHLPVTHAGALVGVLARTDVLAARVRGERIVEPVYTRDPYVVEVHTPLEDVVRELATRHIGSAVVTKHGKLVGILTVTDVCLVLADVLASLRPAPSGDDAA